MAPSSLSTGQVRLALPYISMNFPFIDAVGLTYKSNRLSMSVCDLQLLMLSLIFLKLAAAF